ncbi:MAG: CaiB/BaiF CoA-transferase family protein [Candidatus Promineifilaceae bacterium]
MRPLASLNILDFTTLLPGPFATMMLADMGADVLRIEAPNRPDMVRFTPPFDGTTSAWHALLGRNKRSLALDLKHGDAAAIIHRLLQKYDIVVEQFRPGVMERLGLGYETLRAIRPDLIYCSITGYGQTGPYRDRAGHDLNYLALAGVLGHSGRKQSGPTPLGVQVADVGGGSFGAVTGILAAVIQRQVSGVGQWVDISMFDMSVAWNSLAVSQFVVGGSNPTYESWTLNGGSFYDTYRTADGRYLSVGSLEPKFWAGFCQTIGRPNLINLGHVQDAAIQFNLKAELRQIIAQKPLAAWLELFAEQDVCVEPVLTVEEMLAHPHTQARQLLVDVPKPDGSTQKQIASPFHFSASQPEYRHVGGAVGADTAEVLGEMGWDAAAVQALRASGVLGGG